MGVRGALECVRGPESVRITSLGTLSGWPCGSPELRPVVVTADPECPRCCLLVVTRMWRDQVLKTRVEILRINQYRHAPA